MILTSSPEVVPPEDSEAGSDLMAAAQRAADAARAGVKSGLQYMGVWSGVPEDPP